MTNSRPNGTWTDESLPLGARRKLLEQDLERCLPGRIKLRSEGGARLVPGGDDRPSGGSPDHWREEQTAGSAQQPSRPIDASEREQQGGNAV